MYVMLRWVNFTSYTQDNDMPGMIIVLEGVDGCGKSTQVAMLADHMKKQAFRVRIVDLPRRAVPPYGVMVAQFLRGDYGKDVDPYLAALLFALDRMQMRDELCGWLANGDIILFDRYVSSNIAYQSAKIEGMEEKKRFTAWVEDLEFGFHALPRPNIELFLDVPPAFSLDNLHGRANKPGYTDIHEECADFQLRVRKEFHTMMANKVKSPAMTLVDCRAEKGDGIADALTVHARVVDALAGRLR